VVLTPPVRLRAPDAVVDAANVLPARRLLA
jgi:hypothetical protein